MTDLPFTCDHCRLPIPDGELVTDRIGENDRRFCCQGCRGAFRIITGAGMADFYRRRSWREPGLPEGVFDTSFGDAYLEDFVMPVGEGAELTLLIEGIRCATCIWLIERILAGIPGVRNSRVNYGTHRARVHFDPAVIRPREIVAALSRIGYVARPYTADQLQQTAEAERRRLLIRFGTAFFLSMQLMGYSFALYAGYFQGMDGATRNLVQSLAALVTTPVVFYAGWPFLAGGWRSLVNRAPGMDLLIAIGVLSAYGYSLFALLQGGEVYFDTAAMIVTLVLAGRLFENAARSRTSAGVDRLLQLAPDTARRIEGEAVVEMPSARLQPGDLVQVRPGERFPVDGKIVRGESEVDDSVVTGEPLPTLRGTGSTVVSGTLNLSASVILRVDRAAAVSFVARVAGIVEEAQARKAPVQALADRVSAVFVPGVIAVALATWAFWTWQGGDGATAMLHAVAVLVVACPCALGLATPTAVLVASGSAAARGILFRGGDVLESCGRLETVAFDKTGTLTLGRPRVTSVEADDGDERALLQLAVRAEGGSNHPLAAGILAEARRRGVPFTPEAGSSVHPGRGVERIDGQGRLRVGNRAFLVEAGITPPTGLSADHLTEVHVALDGIYRGRFLLDDPLRPGAAEMITRLHACGLRTALLTGDRRATGERIAERIGIGEVCGSLNPEQKAHWVTQRQVGGAPVLMVGDGINDAPALSTAAVGCAMGGGTDIALETSDLILTRPDLNRLPEALTLARRTLCIIRQNLAWAFAYNLAAVPLAVTGNLAPVHAAAAMALSSICVVGNSLRIGYRKKESGGQVPSKLSQEGRARASI